jgi:hypothetical protein
MVRMNHRVFMNAVSSVVCVCGQSLRAGGAWPNHHLTPLSLKSSVMNFLFVYI